MTIRNITQDDKALLAACRKYIQVTDTTPKIFVDELMDLASQYLSNYPSDQHLFQPDRPTKNSI